MNSKIFLLTLLPAFSANAATVAYYQFEDASADANAVTLASEFNSPALDGTASAKGTNSQLPKFSSDTPGAVITNGVGGSVFNGSNTTSLEFINGNGGVANTEHAIGGQVTIDGSTSLNAANFTMEGFIKVDTFINYSTIFSKSRSNGNIAWQLDTNNNGQLRARFDTLDGGIGVNNQGFNSTGTISDGQWHHVALTYNGTTSAFEIFMDYASVRSGTVTGPLILDGGDVTFGSSGGASRSFDGLIDEARFTDSVLATADFLRAVPEPSSAFLAVATACLGLLRRKRH